MFQHPVVPLNEWVNRMGPTSGIPWAGAVALLILPPLLDIAPALGPTAAIGLALLQVGAVNTHLKRGEPKVLPMNLALLALAAVAAWAGFSVWG